MKTAHTYLFLAVIAMMRLLADASPLLKRSGCYSGSKKAILTNYWIPQQGMMDMDNNGNIIHLSGPDTDAILASDGSVIVKVDHNTHAKCAMEGSCVVHKHGKDILINLSNNGGSDPRFEVLDKEKTPFGIGSGNNNPLAPFVSVAVNDLPFGSKLYVKDFDGLKLPNGLTHNGCVRVDDNGWSFGGCQLDWFVLSYENYVKLNSPGGVTARKQDCTILDYSTDSAYGYVGVNPPRNAPAPGKGGASPHKGTKTTGTPKPSSTPHAASGITAQFFSDTNFGGSVNSMTGTGCYKLSGVTKSAKWPTGKKLILYASSGCSGETLYVDTEGEDTDLSGDGQGFHAGSASVQ